MAQADACALARQMGLNVAYIAAPFDAAAVEAVLPSLDLVILNEVEAAQLSHALGKPPSELGISDVIITRGSDGAVWHPREGNPETINPIAVHAVDSTGAGDTFAGYVLACLDRGQPMKQALRMANLAAAIMVTRYGTGDVIPDLKDLDNFRRP